MNQLLVLRPALLASVLTVAMTAAWGQALPRGQLLYSTHCVECHNTQMHWRLHKQARDWDSLKAQVRRWQTTAHLNWTEGEIVDVARHLNETIYQFPEAQEQAGTQPGRLFKPG